MHTGPEDTTRDDHGENLTFEVCEDLPPQASGFLHDLLHGKHDKALHAKAGRTGDEIECVYIHEERPHTSPEGEESLGLHLTVEFLEAPPHLDLSERVEVRALFSIKVLDYTSNRPDAELQLVTPDNEDQLRALQIETGTCAPRKRCGVQYDVAVWGPDKAGNTHHYFEVWGKDGEEPVLPFEFPLPSTPVACDADLPF